MTRITQASLRKIHKQCVMLLCQVYDKYSITSLYYVDLFRCRERNYGDVERLLIDASEGDVNKYESFDELHRNLGDENRESIVTMIHDVIKSNLLQADSIKGLKVGRLCKVSQNTVFILYLRVCDVTDPNQRVRSRLCD